ncbi:hypothetical protein [Chitinophaga sp.]|uniref:hypothetical protein n=1 Tax=Chitinophaga sp. TaxID=1869181 RepID=UPI0031D29FC3
MEHDALLERIKENIIRKKRLTYTKNIALTRASKFAYYNPAKTDKDGNVVIRTLPPLYPFIGIMALGLTIQALFASSYYMLIISLPALIFSAVLVFIFPGPDIVTINKKGMTIHNKEYLWDDYIGVYYFIVPGGKGNNSASLVLIRPDGSYGYLDSNAISNWNKIGTAIRDFQPPHYI